MGSGKFKNQLKNLKPEFLNLTDYQIEPPEYILKFLDHTPPLIFKDSYR